MNVKILLTPLLIAITIGFAVWFVYPAYSNGADGVKEKYSQLKGEEEKFEGLKNKNQKAEKIFSEISSLGTDKDVLYQFIPEKLEEEEILDNLNYLASISGISISKFTISQTASNIDRANARAVSSSDEPVLEKPKKIEMGVNLAGNYENIKSFLDKVDKLRRFENFSVLQIEKNKGTGVEGEVISSDVLNMNAKIEFNFLNKVRLSEKNFDDSIFANPSEQLDLSAINEIKDKKNTEILNLETGQKGKVNPFMP